MALEYARALLLTIVFMAGNFLAGVIIFGLFGAFASDFAQEEWNKLLLAPPFLFSLVPVFGLTLLWSGMAQTARLTGLDFHTPVPNYARPARILRSPAAMFVLLVVLPAAVQLLGSELETLSRIAYPHPELYARLQGLLRPAGTWPDLVGAVFTLGLVGPACEELLFRGVILGGLLQKSTRWLLPVLFQALLFALVHLNPWQFAYALPMGVLLGWLRVRTGSVWPPLLLHTANNLAAVLVMHLAPPLPWLYSEDFNAIVHVPWPLLAVTVAVCALALGFLGRRSAGDATKGEP